MYSWKNFMHKFKKYGIPSKKEVIGLIVTSIVFAFIISFRDWGSETFSVTQGMYSFLLSFMLVVIAMSLYEVTNRTIALWMGYRTEYKTWIPGLLIGLVVTFISNGYLPLILPGSIIVTHMAIHRLGKFFYELNMNQVGWIAMSGSISLIVFAAILKPFDSLFAIKQLIKICVLIAVFNMLPIPPMNGLRTFFGSRFVYVFVLTSIIAASFLLTVVSGLLSIIGGIFIGIILLIVFFSQVDKRW